MDTLKTLRLTLQSLSEHRRQPTAWAGKTYAEIEEIAREYGSIPVFPVGGIEQHGPHLPVATDTICADALAHEGAQTVVDDIPAVGPVLWAGNSPYHVGLPGRIDVRFSQLVEFYGAMAASALETGFDALLFLNGHGGNHDAIGGASRAIGLEHPDIEVLAMTYFGLAAEFIDEMRDSDPGGMNHAGELESYDALAAGPRPRGQSRRHPSRRAVHPRVR